MRAAGAHVIFHAAANITRSGGWDSTAPLNIDGTGTQSSPPGTNEGAPAPGEQRGGVRTCVPLRGGASPPASPKTSDRSLPLVDFAPSFLRARSKRESEQLVMDAHRAAGSGDRGAARAIYGPGATASSFLRMAVAIKRGRHAFDRRWP